MPYYRGMTNATKHRLESKGRLADAGGNATIANASEPPACRCGKCTSYCHRKPGWPTPEEAERLMDAGETERLMLDWWVGDFHDGANGEILIVCPAAIGSGGEWAPEIDMMSALSGHIGWGCEMLTKGLCQLHARGLKPAECRLAYHEDRADEPNVHREVAREWDSERGREVAARFMRACSIDERE